MNEEYKTNQSERNKDKRIAYAILISIALIVIAAIIIRMAFWDKNPRPVDRIMPPSSAINNNSTGTAVGTHTGTATAAGTSRSTPPSSGTATATQPSR